MEGIAHGGRGEVYKGRQVSLNPIVALRMVWASAFAPAIDVQPFRIKAASNLDQPHIVSVNEVGPYDGRQYFPMEFVEETSLSRHPRADINAEVASLVHAVQDAHQHGVLRRDRKVSDIRTDARGNTTTPPRRVAARVGNWDV